MGPSRRQDMRAAVPGHGCARKVEDRADASKSHHHPGARHQMGMRKRPETVATPGMHSPNGPLSAVGAATIPVAAEKIGGGKATATDDYTSS